MLRLSVRSLLAHKIRFAMTSFAVVLGVSFVVGSMVVTDTVRHTFDTLFAEINDGIDLEIRSESSFTDGPGQDTREPFSADVLDRIVEIDGVAAAEGGVGGFAQPIDNDGDPVTTMGAPLIGFSWGARDDLSPVSLAQGDKPDAAGEIAIDEGTFDDYDFTIGQQVDVLLAGGRETFTLVGTATFGESNSLAGARLTMFEPREAQRVFEREGLYDAIDIAIEPGADRSRVQAAIAAALPDGLEVVTGTTIADEGADAIASVAGVFGTVLLAFAGIALFVSAFYIYNTFSITLGQRVRELGLLRAVGASTSQIRRMVLVEALLIGTAASVVGIGAGLLTAQGLRGLLNAGGMGLPADALILRRGTIVAALVVGVGVTLAAAVLPARTASSVPPITAMRDGSDGAARSPRTRLTVGVVFGTIGAALIGFGLFTADGAVQLAIGLGGGAALVFFAVAMLSPLVAGPVASLLGTPVGTLFGSAGRLARQNAMRNPYRTASTAAALTIGLALVTMALVVGTSVKETFASIVDRSVKADIVITEPSFNGFSPTVAADLDALPELDAVTGVRFGPFRIDGNVRDVVAVGPRGGDVVDIDVRAGGSVADLGPTGIFVHRDPARDLGLEPGDEITVEFSRTGEQTFTVVGVHGDSSFAGNYLISLEAWDANFTDHLDAVVMATAADGIPATEVRRAITEVTTDFPNLDVQDRQEFLDAQIAQIDQLLVTVNALLLLAVIIAVLGIGNTLALSVFERTRELGLLRAVGMSRRQVRRMVRWESAIVALFGAVLGVGVGIVFGLGASAALPESFIDHTAIPTGSLVVLLVAAVAAGLAAAQLPARRASRLDILRAIQTE